MTSSGEKMSDELQRTERAVKLSSRLQVPGWGDVLLNGKSRFDEVEDLFLDSRHQGVEALVKVSLKWFQGTAGSMKDYVQIPVEKKQPQFLRIGNVSIPDMIRFETETRRTNNSEWSPGCCWPILATHDENVTTFKFNAISGYDLVDHCIGDVDDCSSIDEIEYDTDWRCGTFSRLSQDAETGEGVLTRLRKHIKDDGGSSQLTGMPFLPTCYLSALDPRKYGQALKKWPKDDVDIAVRIVNHHNDFDSASFPKEIRKILCEHDEVEQVCKLAGKSMNVKGEQVGQPVDSKRLFGQQFRSRWRLELWVMPQCGTRKLFHYNGGSLLQFLDGTEFARPQIKNLYVEAHVMRRMGSR